MGPRQKLHLIDGSGYIFRAYYAIGPLRTSSGLPTNAVYGFARMLGKLLRDEKPQWLAIAFDTPEKNFRHALSPAYKAGREAPPEDLIPQFALIHEFVACMRIPVLMQAGYEADDLIATLVAQSLQRRCDVVVVSGDKDLMQLVGPHVTMFDPLKGKFYDEAAVQERFGVPPHQVADFLALAGDNSDNISGVPSVGPKTAAKLVQTYGDLENVIAGLARLSKRKATEQAVLDHAETARLAKRLVTLVTDAPIQPEPQALHYSGAHGAELTGFLQKIEAHSLLRDLAATSAAEDGHPPPVATAPKPQGGIDRSRYRTIATPTALASLVAAMRAAPLISLDLETTHLDALRADIVGIAICLPGEDAAYIPLQHRYMGAPSQLPLTAVLSALQPLLEDKAVAKVGQNIKYDSLVLARAGIALRGIAADAMVAAYVLDPSKPSYSLDALAREYLGHQNITYDEVTGTGKNRLGFDSVTVEAATQYAGEDADVALRLCTQLGAKIDQADLGALYRDVEIPLISVLAQMERSGILIDATQLRQLSRQLNERLDAVEQRAHAMIGAPINLASPKQLSYLFFEQLGYPVVKKTKTGYSTDQEVLEILARSYELPATILEHRLLAKLKSTYVDALPKLVNPDTGRLHTHFNQTGTATGRLSSSNPNLQNIPIRSEDGRRIRAAFIAPKGSVLISADYSQIELRVLAHLSGDNAFIAAFQQGEDIHRRTAIEILSGGTEPDHEMRRRAKTINFAILYGQSDFGLAKQLNIPRAAAHDYIEAYFGRYPSVREFLDRTVSQARDKGFVSTLLGRRRYLPELQSRNGNVRKAAERIAINTPIQGSAADLIKMAMLRVAAALEKSRLQARLLLQVHDELVLEAPMAERDDAIDLVRREMSQVMPLAVPLTVDVGWGEHWASAHA